MNSLVVDLNILPEEYQRLYAGSAKEVFARARDGRSARFPARILQPFVQRDGIQGTFIIHFDDHNRFYRIEKLTSKDGAA